MSGPQFRADRPAEQEAVRTTIVGGRPPGSGQRVGPIPRGIEILLRKASVDPAFKELLLRQRGGAAETIGLKLESGETMMLTAAPAAQLEAVIARTSVPQEHRRAFLGQAAAAMLAALGAAISRPVHAAEGAVERAVMRPAGIVVGQPVNPVDPSQKAKTVEERVVEIIADQTGIEAKKIKRDDKLVKDLGAQPADLAEIRKDVAKKFDLKVSEDDFKNIGTVGETVDYVEKALKKKAPPVAQPAPVPIRPIMAGVMRGPNN
jgi:acyl carrier protein